MSTSFATSVVDERTSAFTTMRAASTDWMTPSRFATTVTPESRATIALDAGADERLGAEERHRLALHVRALRRGSRRRSRGTARGRRHRHELVRRHVHEVDLVRPGEDVLALLAARDGVPVKMPFLSTGALACAMMCFSSWAGRRTPRRSPGPSRPCGRASRRSRTRSRARRSRATR